MALGWEVETSRTIKGWINENKRWLNYGKTIAYE
jgi:hypothetical protein